MTVAYVPPITRPAAIFTLHVRRFDPESEQAPAWVAYQVPWVPSMTVIQALEHLWDRGVYVAFRSNCREFTCGSCAMVINGKPGLACDTALRDGTRIEPLGRYPVIRDLVVDTGAVPEKWQRLALWPHRRGEVIVHVPPRVQADHAHIYARCIECYACLDACPASDSEAATFDGPMWMLQLARSAAHPLDGQDRLAQAEGRGVWECVSCFECADACPIGLSPGTEIHKLRHRILVERIRSWLRLRKR